MSIEYRDLGTVEAHEWQRAYYLHLLACRECGALVPERTRSQHDRWHEEQDQEDEVVCNKCGFGGLRSEHGAGSDCPYAPVPIGTTSGGDRG